MTEPMTDAELRNMQRRLDPNAFFQSTIVDAETVRRILARLDAERSRADAAQSRYDQKFDEVVELIGERVTLMLQLADAKRDLAKAEAARDAALESEDALRGDLREMRARALPAPVLMETVEQVAALPAGNYLVRFTAIAGIHSAERDETDPPSTLVWHVPGDDSQWPDGAFVGATILGPLPDLPIPPANGDAP